MELTSGSLIALVTLVVTLMDGTITLVVVLLSKRISDLDQSRSLLAGRRGTVSNGSRLEHRGAYPVSESRYSTQVKSP